MSHLSLQAVSGLFVLLAGLAVVIAVASGPGNLEVAPETPSMTPDIGAAVVEVPPPGLEGVDLAVQRVLYASGKAEALRIDQLSELSPEVARTLVYFGATLTIATSPAGER